MNNEIRQVDYCGVRVVPRPQQRWRSLMALACRVGGGVPYRCDPGTGRGPNGSRGRSPHRRWIVAVHLLASLVAGRRL